MPTLEEKFVNEMQKTAKRIKEKRVEMAKAEFILETVCAAFINDPAIEPDELFMLTSHFADKVEKFKIKTRQEIKDKYESEENEGESVL